MNYLSDMGDIKLNQIVDEEGYSLLHMAAFSNRTKIVEELLWKAK